MQLSDLDITKTYSYADYLQWTFEDRLELIKGKIFEMTLRLHQTISTYRGSFPANYIIISPQDKTFLKYTLFEGLYQPSRLMTIGDVITTQILPGFELDLEMVFSDSDN